MELISLWQPFFFNGQKNRHFTKENMQMENKHPKRFSTPFSIGGNSNHDEIAPHALWGWLLGGGGRGGEGERRNWQHHVLVRTRSNENSPTCTLTASCEVKHTYMGPPTPRYLSKKNENIWSHKNQYMNVYSGFIHSCQKLKSTQMPINLWMD